MELPWAVFCGLLPWALSGHCYALAWQFRVSATWHCALTMPWEPMTFHGLSCTFTNCHELSRGNAMTMAALMALGLPWHPLP